MTSCVSFIFAFLQYENGTQSTDDHDICLIYNYNYDQLNSDQIQNLDLAKETNSNLTDCPSFRYNTTIRTIVTDVRSIFCYNLNRSLLIRQKTPCSYSSIWFVKGNIS